MKKNNTQIIFGLHACLAALNNKIRKINGMICTESILNNYKTLIDNRGITNITIKKRKQIDQDLGTTIHQGIVLDCDEFKKKTLKLEDKDSLILILDSLNDSQNVGAIIRCAYLFGVKKILYTKHRSFEINPFLIKSASGAFEEIDLIEVNNLNQSINILKKENFWIVGLDINSNSNFDTLPKDTKLALIIGSENKGIKRLSLQNCDFRINIKTIESSSIDSLNVSHATAIALYELTKL
jgi:23S rRNA (guanosine2251-2'-O)-methyltransferase